MLILAIDTALDACAAAVLDTDANRLVLKGSLPMKRGHAEALMPLLDRVMTAAAVPVWRPRPHCGDHGPRQLHRIARRAVGRARPRARR